MTIRRFNRFELKYIIPVSQRDDLCEDLRHQMTTDAHGDGAGYYRVTSLYYDAPNFACYHSKIEGIKYRRKVRVRIYGRYVQNDDEIVHLEIKQRINRTVQKRRIRVPLKVANAIIRGETWPEFEDVQDQEVASEVQFLARRLDLEPACVISYLRQAWVGSEAESGLRITFDQALSYRGPEFGLLPGIADRRFMPDDQTILEVKCNEAVPLWVTRMLARHRISLTRVSKYCLGLARLHNLGLQTLAAGEG